MKRRGKGEGTIRKRSDGRWEGRYIDSSGSTRYIYSTNKSELREKLDELTYLKDSNRFDDVAGDVALKVWYEHYIDIKRFQVKERSLNQIKMHIEKHVLPIIGNKILYKITTNDIINVIKSVEAKNLQANTINNVLRHMRAMFNYAFAERVINRNPMLPLKLERDRKSIRRELTSDEINLLLTAAIRTDYNYYLMLCTLLYTGIRAGELCALKWNDFSEDFSSMRIDESFTDLKYENDTKTASGERVIPLNEYLQQEYRNRFYNLSDAERKDLNQLVYVNRCHRPYTSNNISLRLNYLKRYIRENMHMEIDDKITPHYFRHTFATSGILNGVSLKDMQELLGHANTKTLLECYTHTNDFSKSNSIRVIQSAIDLSRNRITGVGQP
ncbi:MAG: tyrosine-type recombinase/integrase [Hominilimicola sp.]